MSVSLLLFRTLKEPTQRFYNITAILFILRKHTIDAELRAGRRYVLGTHWPLLLFPMYDIVEIQFICVCIVYNGKVGLWSHPTVMPPQLRTLKTVLTSITQAEYTYYLFVYRTAVIWRTLIKLGRKCNRILYYILYIIKLKRVHFKIIFNI